MVPIHIDYHPLSFNGTKWTTQYELEDALTVLTTRAGAGYPLPLGAPVRATGDYEIAATFCTPKEPTAGKERRVIVATHGIGPARAHWNVPVEPDKYNFVQFAVAQGYSVFFYDRLGCGASSRYVVFLPSLHGP